MAITSVLATQDNEVGSVYDALSIELMRLVHRTYIHHALLRKVHRQSHLRRFSNSQ